MTEAKVLAICLCTRFDKRVSINFGDVSGWLADEEVQAGFAISSPALIPHLFLGLPPTVSAVHKQV